MMRVLPCAGYEQLQQKRARPVLRIACCGFGVAGVGSMIVVVVKQMQQMIVDHPPPSRRALPPRRLMAAAGIGVVVLMLALASAVGGIVAHGVINRSDKINCSSGRALDPDVNPTKVLDNSSTAEKLQTLLNLHQIRTENSKLISDLQFLRSQQKQESIMVLPYLRHFESGLIYGLVITIKGFVQPRAFRLPVTLKYGPAASDVALLFSPRFETNQMVRNHFHNGVWGSEETSGPVPVRFLQHFHYEIRVLQNMYEIFVNGVHYCDFIHWLPYNRVRYLDIRGDLILTSVTTRQMLHS